MTFLYCASFVRRFTSRAKLVCRVRYDVCDVMPSFFCRLLTAKIIDGTYLPEVLVFVVVVFLQDLSRLFMFCWFYFIWSFSLSALLHFSCVEDRRIMAEEGE
jgi:hypothetical protein